MCTYTLSFSHLVDPRPTFMDRFVQKTVKIKMEGDNTEYYKFKPVRADEVQ